MKEPASAGDRAAAQAVGLATSTAMDVARALVAVT
jgi:hypothetical protein